METIQHNASPLTDKVCICRDCGSTFTITPDEQRWYQKHEYVLPERCEDCRRKRREGKRKFRENVMLQWLENKDALSMFMALKDEFIEFLTERHPEKVAELTAPAKEEVTHD